MYKVYVDTGEPNVATNALEFATVPEAIAYARDLYSRWFKVEGWYVMDDSPMIGLTPSSAEALAAAFHSADGRESIPLASDAVSPRNDHGEHPITLG